jgi:hypothetical protein
VICQLINVIHGESDGLTFISVFVLLELAKSDVVECLLYFHILIIQGTLIS